MVFATHTPAMFPKETSRLLPSSKSSTAKGKGKAYTNTKFDLESQLDGASENPSHEKRPHKNLITREVGNLQQPQSEEVGTSTYSINNTRYIFSNTLQPQHQLS